MNRAFLFTRESSDSILVSTYELPNLLDVIQQDSPDLSNSDVESLSNSLPEPTGYHVSSINSFEDKKFHKTGSELLLNPLGAGDTCSGIFFLEYLDTRVICIKCLIHRMLSLLSVMD